MQGRARSFTFQTSKSAIARSVDQLQCACSVQCSAVRASFYASQGLPDRLIGLIVGTDRQHCLTVKDNVNSDNVTYGLDRL